MKKNGKIVHSALYSCNVYHARMEKVNRTFSYRSFLFYIDMDEIQTIANKIWLISYNRFNYFNFRDQDHLQLDESKVQSTRSQIEQFLQENNIDIFPKRIGLLTNLCTLGYQFNPVSFYYCFDKDDKAFACIAEVNNTFGEMKLFLLTKDQLSSNTFSTRKCKNFYVSPFIDHDVDFDFNLEIPNDSLSNRIDDYRGSKRIFTASLTGKKQALTNWTVLKYVFLFPFITLQVIFLIHYQAFKLLLLGIPYFKKEEHLDLQTNRMKKFENRHTRKNRRKEYGKDFNTSAQNQF
ncbi:DUF1365 domain-containing protein [Marinifilum caeruleilacunae]|uniref:DUF1365 domain-containing protein n=1 Tax=Marinifilum caeruleilacunae TaxID=2499076 RepID=A0ABX1WYI9_9BACT|nr:DUF1365 domain-containing protein [Marinifilum caeruleilacunae]NOU61182.1 DUF1365 domain-containing protein [Marinifilum caeruleilacunae]